MKTKICYKCKQKLSLTEFYGDDRSPDGLGYTCKKCVNKRRRKIYRENPDKRQKVLEYNKQWRKNNPIKFWCQRTIINHKISKYKVLFTSKELFPIAQKTTHCPICKIELKYGGGRNPKNATLDRVNNENFLTLNNIQIICRKCNTSKLNRTMKELYEWCLKVINYFSIEK